MTRRQFLWYAQRVLLSISRCKGTIFFRNYQIFFAFYAEKHNISYYLHFNTTKICLVTALFVMHIGGSFAQILKCANICKFDEYDKIETIGYGGNSQNFSFSLLPNFS